MADVTTLLSRFLGSLQLFSGSASGVLTTSTTSAGTPATAVETTLWTYSLPANTLNIDQQAVRITVTVSYAATANTKTVKLYFGSTVINSVSAAFNGVQSSYSAVVLRTSATAQFSTSTVTTSSAALNVQNGTPAETMANAITIKITGQNDAAAAANDVVFKAAVVELLN